MTDRLFESVGEVVAARLLQRHDLAGGPCDVTILLGKPVTLPGDTCWLCPYQIVGVGSERVKAARGADGIQAVQNAERMIGADLFYFRERLSGALTWPLADSKELGFAEADTT